MKNYTETEIEKLQNSLFAIRETGGWSAEEFGEMIGVTKQTIRNLEIKKTIMSKTQYIAIRTVLDCEIAEHPENKKLSAMVGFCLNAEDLLPENISMAQKIVEITKDEDLSSDYIANKVGSIFGKTIALAAIGAVAGTAVAASTIVGTVAAAGPIAAGTAGIATASWLSKLLKDKKKK